MANELDTENTISLVLLLAIMDKIISEYSNRGLTTVDLGNRQFYHAVAADEMFDLSTTPKALIVGDLHDDIAELKRLTGDDMPTAVDIERLGRVLCAISESVLD